MGCKRVCIIHVWMYFGHKPEGDTLFATCATVDEDLSVVICSKNNQLHIYNYRIQVLLFIRSA